MEYPTICKSIFFFLAARAARRALTMNGHEARARGDG
jgi:hypothetical protein